ncbi:MAG: 7-carboxy-7-deazaguanine synthase QueE [Sediminibacterium sp.]|nr:MAG: hypothetical protein FD183_363 [Chitinophagaceae bacterium]MDP1844525.1 7-carboxy-7-deazaguanine synthase QueE [Sediminibacterium sp.]
MITTNTTIQTLPVMEAFYTLQGEGAHQGRAAYFIRLGGCDVGCFWCDVKESWDASKHPQIAVSEIIAGAVQHPGRLAVITGGEPLLYDLTELTAQLQLNGFETNIETSGSSPLSGSWNWICLSPKKFKAPLPEVVEKANELKVVIYNKHDFEWAETYATQVNANCALFLQPEWDKAAEITPAIIEYIQQHPKWRMCLQVHKYLQIP